MADETVKTEGGKAVVRVAAGLLAAAAIVGAVAVGLKDSPAAADPADAVPLGVKRALMDAQKDADIPKLAKAQQDTEATFRAAQQAFEEADAATKAPAAPAVGTPEYTELYKARMNAKITYELALNAALAAKDAYNKKITAIKEADRISDEEFCKAQVTANPETVEFCARRGVVAKTGAEKSP